MEDEWTDFIQVTQQGSLVYLMEEEHDKEEMAQEGRWGVSLHSAIAQWCLICAVRERDQRSILQNWRAEMGSHKGTATVPQETSSLTSRHRGNVMGLHSLDPILRTSQCPPV